MSMKSLRFSAILAACSVLLMPTPALAYIGPGAGLGAVAVTLAVVVGVVLLLIGLVWYPLKRMIKGKKRNAADQTEADKTE